MFGDVVPQGLRKQIYGQEFLISWKAGVYEA